MATYCEKCRVALTFVDDFPLYSTYFDNNESKYKFVKCVGFLGNSSFCPIQHEKWQPAITFGLCSRMIYTTAVKIRFVDIFASIDSSCRRRLNGGKKNICDCFHIDSTRQRPTALQLFFLGFQEDPGLDLKVIICGFRANFYFISVVGGLSRNLKK